jgi:hypothetical protein
MVLWCSWLSLLSNTQAVLSSSLSGIIPFDFFALYQLILLLKMGGIELSCS